MYHVTITKWWDSIERILTRATAKPYRSRAFEASKTPYQNEKGYVDFSPNDVENPKNWSARRRWYISVMTILLVVNATMASSSPSGCVESLSEHFHVSIEATGLVVTLFLLGYCFGPLFWAPLSEFYGRRWIYYIAFVLYFAFTFLCAFAPNFGALLVGRFLAGTAAACALSNAGGTLADIWGPVERGNAMALFAMMTFIGPALGPVTSGFFQLKKDWRWTFYELLWLGAVTLLTMLTIPETFAPQILLNKAQRIRRLRLSGLEHVKAPVEGEDRSLASIYKIALTRPWIILFDPISFLVAIYISVVYTLLYMLFTIYPIVFQQKRGWNPGVGELPLLGTVIGAVIGGAMVFYSSSRDARKTLAGWKRKPEDRLPLAMIGGVIFPITMFWLAWTGEYDSVHWIVPTLSGVFLSTSILLIFVGYLNYLIDTYLMYAASSIAANTILRSACAAAAPLYTQYMFDAMGVGGGGSLIGGVAVILAPIPFVFYRYGESIRMRSRFAPTKQPSLPPGLVQEHAGEVPGGEHTSTAMYVDGEDEEKRHTTSDGTKLPPSNLDTDVESGETKVPEAGGAANVEKEVRNSKSDEI